MIIVDVETTGVDPHKNSLVSIGAIDFNNPSNQFYAECRIWEGAHINDEALVINGYTKEQITDPSKKTEEQILAEFLDWMAPIVDHTIAGQNPFFDTSFIEAAAARYHKNISIAHRIIDLHTMTWFHMKSRGITPPIAHNRTDLNSDTIMAYVGIPAEPKPHIALNGAKYETEAFSRLINDKSCFTEFEQFKVPFL